MLVIDDKFSIPLTEFEFKFSRSPGPGGQNVNKVNTKVSLRWSIAKSRSVDDRLKSAIRKKYSRRINNDDVMIVNSHRYRDQGRNVADCLNKLRELIIEANQKKRPRKKTRPSKSSIKKRLDNKKRNAAKKELRRPIE